MKICDECITKVKNEDITKISVRRYGGVEILGICNSCLKLIIKD